MSEINDPHQDIPDDVADDFLRYYSRMTGAVVLNQEGGRQFAKSLLWETFCAPSMDDIQKKLEEIKQQEPPR